MPRLPFDFQLQDKESSPGTILQLILAEEEGRKLWSESRFQPIPPGQRSGAANSATKDPQGDLIWSQDDWSGGALVPVWSPREPNGYAGGSMDARHKGMLVQGIPRNYGSDHGNDTDPISLVIPNPHFEAPTAKIKWTDQSLAGVTLTLGSTGDARTALFGDQSAKIVSTAATAGVIFSFSAANPTVYQGKSITFTAYVKHTAGDNGATVEIYDGVGTSTGATVTATTWTAMTVTRTIDAGATEVTFRVNRTATGTSGTFYVDDATVYSGTSLAPTRIVELDGEKYATFGRIVAQLRTGTTDTYIWDAVYIHASASATDIEVYKDKVYVAFGAAQDYIYGATTSWTVSTGGTGNANKAIKFGVSRDTLWKAETVNTLKKSTTNPTAGADWGSAYTVGADDANRTITRLYDHEDRLIVCKGDGIWYYLRVYEDGTSADTFVNATREFETFTSTSHFTQGTRFSGDLYLNTGTTGLYRLRGARLDNLTSLVSRPSVSLNGKVHALASDPMQLWAFVGDRLLSLNPNEDGRLIPFNHLGPSISTEVAGTLASSQKNTGATSAGTGANRDSTTGGSWASVSNITASDDSRARMEIVSLESATPDPGSKTDHLQATNFSFSIPTGASIDGIKVEIEDSHVYDHPPYFLDYDVKLLKAGTAVGDNKATGRTVPATASEAYTTYGSSSDTWGASWTAADVNGSTFGVEIQYRTLILSSGSYIDVDHVRITVYYTESSVTTDGITPRTAATTWWAISTVQHPVLLSVIEGIDSGSIPYAITDCWTLPHARATDVLNPTDTTPELLTTSYIDLSSIDLGFPNEDKVFNYLILRFEDVDATQTTKVTYGLDGTASSSISLGTFNGNDVTQTLYFDDLTDPVNDAVGKVIQLRLESTYTSTTNNKRIKAIELHTRLANQIVKEWDVTFHLGSVMMNNGNVNPESKAEQLAKLNILETQKYPIRMVEDFNGDGASTTHACYIIPGTLRLVESSQYASANGLATYTMRLREQKVAD